MTEKVNFAFLSTLQDSSNAIKYCMRVGLISEKYKCPKCANWMKLVNRSGRSDEHQWRCKKVDHDVRRSIRKGTWFEESNLSIYNILMLTYMWCLKLPTESMINDLGLASDTVVNWCNFCREICVNSCVINNEKLGGEGKIVEIDESKFGKRKYQRGKWVEGRWVFGGIERGTDNCFMLVVEDRSRNTLLSVIKDYIKPGTTIISDCWKAYDCLEDEGFKHLTVNHTYTFKDSETGAHTNSIEGTWSGVKRRLRGNSCKGHFNNYLYEYMWRRKNKLNKKELFNRFVEAIIQVYPPIEEDN